MADAAVVVTTHNALPWIEQCLESVEGVETVVVDNDSSDGTVAFVREPLPRRARRRAGEPRSRRRLGAGASRRSPPSRWALILNADAWLVGDALERMVAIGDAHPARRRRRPEAAQSRTASLQRSVRGFPTRWRLATEYLYLRKLGPRHRAPERLLRRRASTTPRSARSSA